MQICVHAHRADDAMSVYIRINEFNLRFYFDDIIDDYEWFSFSISKAKLSV